MLSLIVAAAVVSQAQAEWLPKPGDIVGVKQDGGGRLTCSYFLDFNRLCELREADDLEGVRRMIEAGKLHLVQGGPRARVIKPLEHVQSGHIGVEVRILEGPKSGRLAWFRPVDLDPNPPEKPPPAPAKKGRRRR